MINFLISFLKGLYPYFLVFACIGIFIRIREKKWMRFDSLLLFSFLLFELLTALLPFFFYKKLTISRRYLFVFIPLYLPFAAEGFLFLWKKLKRHSLLKAAAVLSVLLFMAFSINMMCHPAVREYSSKHKRKERTMNLAAAEWIRKDWQGRAAEPVKVMKCDTYQSGKRPLVDAGKYTRIGYLCGGQNFSPFMAENGLTPDYIVTGKEEKIPGWQMAGHIESAFIYKRSDKDKE